MTITARIIDDAPHSAAFNMAADLHLLSLCDKSPAVTVRFYSWEKPSITLGVSENPHETLDLVSLGQAGAEWTRRPTGGRSVLHHGDITYSCIFSAHSPGMGTTLMETYRVISDCLMAGLALAGINCSRHDSPLDRERPGSKTRLPCFLSPNRHEIMAAGRKLVGSAQKRTAGAVLQHGSIPVSSAFRNLPDFLRLSPQEREAQKALLEKKCACVQELRPDLDEKELRSRLIRGFRETLPFESSLSPWTPEEIGTIETIANSREFREKWQG
jgi:lipoyl(octanoyl) transferase